MNVKVNINWKEINAIKDKVNLALVETAEALHDDLIQSETMPFETGNLQNRSTFVDKTNAKKGKVRIASDTMYARRLYFHPQYNFSHEKNKNAGGKWFEPYISGRKKKMPQQLFERFLKGLL